MKKKITSQHLPPSIVHAPRVRSQSQHVERTTTVLLLSVLFALILFSIPEFTGNATTATTVNVTQTTPQNCTFDLEPGLNVVSFNCISNNEDRDAVLASTDTSLISVIYTYNNKQADQWHVYNPNLPSYVVNDLSTFSRMKGYLFYLSPGSGTLIDYQGNIATETSIPMFTDNNLVGFPSIINRTLPEGLTTINDSYWRVRTFNGSAWIEYNKTHNSTGGLTQLTPYQGYWITINSTDNWVLGYNG